MVHFSKGSSLLSVVVAVTVIGILSAVFVSKHHHLLEQAQDLRALRMLSTSSHAMTDQLYGELETDLVVPAGGAAHFNVELKPLESRIFRLNTRN